ncbi:MAG: hypothetical protein HWQ41_13795 [Nostoc sp. NOS(2021)]|uniref:hypothetical protein n=1 Tax=Nostoc sp. NOS(2021) TaxID=2815407 RepID=UPI0025DBD7EA|nr:hypothetical protein [Nostoc sp. NOS(2021)]MBN3896290.1 hypothetical protein [Nostoc sp. NOS(2021)]
MESQTSQLTILNAQTLQQLEDEIKNELSHILKNSNFGEVLNKYGISGQNILKVQCLLDFTQIEVSDADGNQESKKFLQTIIQEQNTTLKALPQVVFCKPCPVPGYPSGCWVD